MSNILQQAQLATTENPEAKAAWALVLQGIEAGWFDAPKLMRLVQTLQRGEDSGVQELTFENRGERVGVTLLSDDQECDATELRRLMYSTLARAKLHPGTIEYFSDDKKTSTRPATDVPDGMQFADTPSGPLPVVKVVMRERSPTERDITEYGPDDVRLRSTRMHKA